MGNQVVDGNRDSFHFWGMRAEKEYDAYSTFLGVHFNGKHIDENVAGLGGIAGAFDGCRASHFAAKLGPNSPFQKRNSRN